MVAMTIRNIPDETHRALKLRAAKNKRSTEAEMRAILEEAVRPEGRLKLGTALAEIGRDAGFTEEELEFIRKTRVSQPAEPISFE